MEDLTFAEKLQPEQRQQLKQLLDKPKKLSKKQIRKIKNEAQWIFCQFFEDHIPSVPHHLVGGRKNA